MFGNRSHYARSFTLSFGPQSLLTGKRHLIFGYCFNMSLVDSYVWRTRLFIQSIQFELLSHQILISCKLCMYTRSHMPWMQFAYANIIIYHGHSTPSSIGKVLHETAHIHHGIQDNQPGGSALNSLSNAHCTQQIRLFPRFAHIQRCMRLFCLSRWPEFSLNMSEWQKRKDNFCFCFLKGVRHHHSHFPINLSGASISK